MQLNSAPGTPSRAVARVAVSGMSLAVLALGALAVWSAFVTQREADGLSRVGVQTTGQLRAVQALYVIRIETDELEEEVSEERLTRLGDADRMLADALRRMESGGVRQAVRVAQQAQPLASQLPLARQRFIDDPTGDIQLRGDGTDDTSEEAMEEVVDALEALLNDPGSDPAQLLADRLDTVHDAGLAVRGTAFVLIPLGLLSVVACGWLLSDFRRRSEATMRVALEETAREARTDQLTCLPNRRALMEELDRRIRAGRVFTVALADLNGFKHYNDTFGHPAGDALLRRLGRKLAVAFQHDEFAARLGGDEFCVMAENLSPQALQARLQEALTEHGEGFNISAVCGLATVPVEAGDLTSALSLADNRLYAAKAQHHGRRGRPEAVVTSAAEPGSGTTAPTSDDMVDLRTLGLSPQLEKVATLAVASAQRLGLTTEEVVYVERAAQFHDIGKAALPAAILSKRGTLTDDEQGFMRQHSMIGERLLTGIDDLQSVAATVRATHERWDGTGYPDQLAGHAIPVGARIIAVADAFTAMTSDRPHAAARSIPDALAELHRCAGNQFDPAVVDAVTVIINDRLLPAGPVSPAGLAGLAGHGP